jgi:hypothetical protein
MLHAKSLRVIGQVLEAARIPTFELEKYGPEYMVWCDSVAQVAELVVRNALRQKNDTPIDRPTTNRVFCFSPADVSRLDAHAQRQRRHQSSSGTPVLKLLSQGLRTLGDHFDRMQVDAFRIEWNVGSVSVDFQRLNRERNCMTLTAVELQHLCEHTRAQRRSTGRVDSGPLGWYEG